MGHRRCDVAADAAARTDRPALRTTLAMTREPLMGSPTRDAGRVRSFGDRPVQRSNSLDEQRAHVWRGLGVRMKLHSEPPLGLNGTCGNAHSFQRTPSEQPD